MRRILAAVALSAVVLSGAACSDSDESGSPSGPAAPSGVSASATAQTGSSTSASPGTAGTGSEADKQVCLDVEKLMAESTTRFGQELVKAVQGGAEQTALTAVKKLFADWAAGLRSQAAKATNPELKDALELFANELEKLNSQIKTMDDLAGLENLDTPGLDAASDKLSTICG